MKDSIDPQSAGTVNDSSSTTRNYSITPVAHRTRAGLSSISYIDAARAGQCKMCPIKCSSIIRLQKHILSHKTNRKRQKALDAVLSVLKAKKAMYTPLSSRANKPCSLERKYIDLSPEVVQANGQVSLEANQLEERKNSSPTIGLVLNDILEQVQTELPCLAAQDPLHSSSSPMFASIPGLSSTPLGSTALEGSMLDKPLSPFLTLPLILEPLPKRGSQTEGSPPPNAVDSVMNMAHSQENIEGLPRPISPIRSPCQEKSPSILDIIMSQEFYSREASPEADVLEADHSPMESSGTKAESPSPISSPPVNTNVRQTENTNRGPVVLTYLEAARSGLCRICNRSVPPTLLLSHLNSHRPCTKRYKCIRAVVLFNKEEQVQAQKLARTYSGNTLKKSPTQIEKTFREKFPELPVFKKKTSMSSPESSDRESLLSELDSPSHWSTIETGFYKENVQLGCT
ncbi:hypothetical protein NPIL_78251 [Nephila pilipes]|uniref:Uncharacterized protein n=1 Tax=Nephila pilipes TaxID=299642 RepID=A0A8X6TC74_NEPPI|nr:hypothetical protein NPIL_78251 [Nephila pilipes]